MPAALAAWLLAWESGLPGGRLGWWLRIEIMIAAAARAVQAPAAYL